MPGVRAGVGSTYGRVTMLKTDCTMTAMILGFWTESTDASVLLIVRMER